MDPQDWFLIALMMGLGYGFGRAIVRQGVIVVRMAFYTVYHRTLHRRHRRMQKRLFAMADGTIKQMYQEEDETP